MGLIYKIENKITNDVYIGQTVYTLERRWHQHIKEAQEALDGKRQSFPLFHRMIIKYGKDNFLTSQVEECDDNLLDEREQYWIEYFDSYNNGYNRTIGGQAQPNLINHSSDVSEFSINGEFLKHYDNVRDAAKEKNISDANIRHCCNKDYITCGGSIWQWGNDKILHRELPMHITGKRSVQQLDKQNNILNTYNSIADASRETGICYQSIYNVCRGKAKTAGKYKWTYI